MRIAVDAMGGDFAPVEIVKGAVAAAVNFHQQVMLVGPRQVLADELKQYTYPDDAVSIVDATEVIAMNEHPAQAVRHKKNSSLVIATRLVKAGEADAIISAGSTGAQMAAALLILGRIPGIDRPGIATVLPSLNGPKVLIDSGANVDTRANQLCQFALLGSAYAEKVVGISRPKVALINVGSEPTKGSEVVQESYRMLEADDRINFTGNVEGRDFFTTDADVLVCDGFVGNVILKLTEGLVSALMGMIKEEILQTPLRRLGGLLIRPGMKKIASRLNYLEYGGAPLLGVKGISMICHGSSDARAIRNAVRFAAEAVEQDFLGKVLAQFQGTD